MFKLYNTATARSAHIGARHALQTAFRDKSMLFVNHNTKPVSTARRMSFSQSVSLDICEVRKLCTNMTRKSNFTTTTPCTARHTSSQPQTHTATPRSIKLVYMPMVQSVIGNSS